jgi:integrase
VTRKKARTVGQYPTSVPGIYERVGRNGETTGYVARWRDPRPREQTVRTFEEAKRLKRRVGYGIDTGTYRDPRLDRVTFGEWHRRWWPTVEADREPATVAQYESILRLHVLPYLADRRLTSLRRIDLEEWLAILKTKGLGSSSTRTARTLAGMVLGSAVDSGVLPANPMAGLRVPRPPAKARQALTAAEVEALADVIGPQYRALVLVLAYGGLRPGEAAALRRRHLDDLGQLLVEEGLTEVRGHVRIAETKTHQTRVVPLPSSVVELVREHLDAQRGDPDGPMFPTPEGARLRLSNFRRVWDRAAKAASLPTSATPYVLRHTCASLAAQRGVPITTLSKMLGHADPAMTLRVYAHLYPGDLRAAADALEAARGAVDDQASGAIPIGRARRTETSARAET